MNTASRLALVRIAALDRAIRAGEYPNARELADRLEVGHRTVQRDVELLRDQLGAPLAYDAVRHGYYYTDPTYRLPAVILTEGELVALVVGEQVLRQYRGTPYGPDLARAFRKIAAGLSDRVTIDPGRLDSAYSFRTTAPTELDPTLFQDLAAAVLRRRRLVLDYWSASRGQRARREVDPYHLACIDGQWYLIGHCHLRGEVRMFVPGRIHAIECADATFEVPPEFQIEAYLGRSFAALRGGEGESYRVRLRFTGESVKYVRERRWHPSQRSEATADGTLLIEFHLGHLREVERWALSWGPDCEVLEPSELRERVAANLIAAAARYTGTSARYRRGAGAEPVRTGPRVANRPSGRGRGGCS